MARPIPETIKIDLGFPYHGRRPAAERLTLIQQFMEDGGYDSEFLCTGALAETLETKIASILGTPAALWCPSGTMAQAIAARIHTENSKKKTVLLHPTSHLLLHEEDGYKHAHGLTALVAGQWRSTLSADDINDEAACVFIELPQRHSGGRLPSWEELERIKEKCAAMQIPLHMDGARLWGCRPFYGDRNYSEICAGFSSTYVSLYKDIGAMGGAILAGDHAFIEKARAWRARLGGLVIEAWPAMADALRLLDHRLKQMEGFVLKARSLAASIADLSPLKVDPNPVQTNVFHILLPAGAEHYETARTIVANETGIWLSNRFWSYESDDACALEIVVGETAHGLPEADFRSSIARLLGEIEKTNPR